MIRWKSLCILTGILIAVLILFFTNGRFPHLTAPILSNDIDQHRINAALPILDNGLSVAQDFVARHDGLTAVSLTLLKYDNIDQTSDSFLTITLTNANGERIATQIIRTEPIEHNHSARLTFDPIPTSHNQRFTIQVTGGEGTAFSVWGYDLDVYADGQALLSDAGLFTAVQDLAFTTQYQLTGREAGRMLGQFIKNDGTIILLALLVLPLPGALALLAYKPSKRWDKAAWWGTAVSLGIALWPLIWYYTTLINFRWTQTRLWVFVLIGWLIFIILTLRAMPPRDESQGYQTSRHKWRFTKLPKVASPPHPLTPSLPHATLLIVLTASLLTRLLAIRDIDFPLWVDASRHGLITAVMVEKGQVLTNYAPLLPINNFPYHFGFHTLAATLMLMGDFELERLLLIFGQLLNALVPLAIYTAVYFLTRKRGTAVFTTFLVAFPFYFPGYYATWGRFTQLTGMVIMPVLLAFSWQLLCGGLVWRKAWWLVGLLAGGLFLVHFRVFLLYVPFALLIFIVAWRRNGRYLLMAGALTTLLIGSRAVSLVQLNRGMLSSANVPIANYNNFPTTYFTAGWDQYIIWIAVGFLPLSILGLVSWRRWGVLPLVLVGWTAVLFGMVGGDLFGLSTRSIININSMYITLFVPLALLIGILLAQMERWLAFTPRWTQLLSWLAVGGLIAVLLTFGSRLQIEILNPSTILGRSADLAAINWLDDNLPPDAHIANGSWLWLGDTWAGQDGGAWLVPLTQRQASTPPADYIYEPDLKREVNAFNEAVAEIENWSNPETAVWLQQQGITHIFIGEGGSVFDPSELTRNPNVEMIYGRNGAFIFAISNKVPGT